jgi:gamma-glutamyl-gamma-aminobutyrate hydrolase PuuD
MTKLKKIGIVAWKVGNNSFGITTAYYNFLSRFGTVIMVDGRVVREDLDLLVLPGGADVDSFRYNQMPSLYAGRPDPQLEYFDRVMLPKYIKKEIPIFGICRGHQTLAVHMGAKLVQHMYHPTNAEHERTKTSHEVRVVLDEWNDKPKWQLPKFMEDLTNQHVNSMHHQVVSINKLPEDVLPVYLFENKKGTSKAEQFDTDIEALFYPTINAISVQWHPEEIWDSFSVSAINYLLSDEKITPSKTDGNLIPHEKLVSPEK